MASAREEIVVWIALTTVSKPGGASSSFPSSGRNAGAYRIVCAEKAHRQYARHASSVAMCRATASVRVSLTRVAMVGAARVAHSVSAFLVLSLEDGVSVGLVKARVCVARAKLMRTMTFSRRNCMLPRILKVSVGNTRLSSRRRYRRRSASSAGDVCLSSLKVYDASSSWMADPMATSSR